MSALGRKRTGAPERRALETTGVRKPLLTHLHGPDRVAHRLPLGFAPRFCGFQRNVEGTIQTPLNWVAPGTFPSLQRFRMWRIVVPLRSAASAVVMNFAVSRKTIHPLFASANSLSKCGIR